MPVQYSTESIIKQITSGLLSGGLVGILINRKHYFLSCLTFSSVGFLEVAYHLDYIKSHTTHLTYNKSKIKKNLQTTFNSLQRDIQRGLNESSEDYNQELRWLLNDIRVYIDEHIYYGMGFTIACLVGVVALPKLH